MPCPTCSHTMQNLGVQDQRIFWCPRCGTLREYSGEGFVRDTVPIWLRRIVALSGMSETGRRNESQHCSCQITYTVDRYSDEAPRIGFLGDYRGRT